MTPEDLMDAWTDLQAHRADQRTRRTLPQPSGRALTLPEYLAAFGEWAAAIQRYQAAPNQETWAAYQAAGAAWAQAQADLSERGRRDLLAWIGRTALL
jgi:hypothetical protein